MLSPFLFNPYTDAQCLGIKIHSEHNFFMLLY